MDKIKQAQTVLHALLSHVPFDGWSQRALERSCAEAGLDSSASYRLFPKGALDALDLFARRSDDAMLAALSTCSLEKMKIRERITFAVRTRLEHLLPHREAVRRAVGFYLLPHHAPHGLKALYRSVDAMWYAAGDTSTDFNFYTKRMTLAAVYTSTLQFWLNDNSPNREETWAFLDRRIENVMQFERSKHKLRSWFSSN